MQALSSSSLDRRSPDSVTMGKSEGGLTYPPRYSPSYRHPEHAIYTANFDQRVDRVEDMIHDVQHDVLKIYSSVNKLTGSVSEVQHGVDHVYFDHERSFTVVLERISDAFTGLRASLQFHMERLDNDLWGIHDVLVKNGTIIGPCRSDSRGTSGTLNVNAQPFIMNGSA